MVNDDPKGNISEYLRQNLLQRVQNNPGKVYYSEMLYWLSIQKEDFEMAFIQAKAIDRRLNENGEKLLELANICIENEEYDTAIEAYLYVEKKGDNNILYTDARMGLLYARYLKVVNDSDHNQNDLLKLEEEYISTLDDYGKKFGNHSDHAIPRSPAGFLP